MLRKALVVGAFAGVGALCTPALAEGERAEVIHIWTSEGESAAIREVVTRFEAAGGVWLDSAVAGGQNLGQTVFNRIAAGDPPTAYQGLGGRAYEDLLAEGLLNDVDATATADGWRDVLPGPLVDVITNDDGKIFLIPINVHGPNWIWYSKDVLEKAGVTEVPTTYDETFFAAVEKINDAGMVGFAVGGQSFQERFLMESVMLALGGRDYWNNVWQNRDEAAIRSATTTKVFETFRRLSTYRDDGAAGRSWPQNTNMLITGAAGFNVMGDWAKGEFTAAGQQAEVDYGCILPGDKPYFIVHADVMAVPSGRDKGRVEAQQLLAHVAMSAESQIEFNLRKGSLAARTDVDTSRYDACSLKGLASYSDPELVVPSVNMTMTPAAAGLWEDLVTEFFNDDSISIDTAVDRLADIVAGSD
ncbi:hypothetical protein ACMU_17150 [Actibacterium mucosum KCTC 23349]|uniref:Probable sugar-binding periplasmic protein n=1 Tax=Actibacterium mucosum KCTC 23349 TaxID=1454373 RepID=A0A037ZI29_9RHOB|nr:ABC transporter substrate-binding protein [Actibacterium mucosum]KAJ54440.1 hypothetical protein ACMU_17150 [Actibacterium mucosum KCTC 23349]